MSIQLVHAPTAATQDILSTDALNFVATLQRCFNQRRLDLLAARDQRQTLLENGHLPTFLNETQHIRSDATWKCAPPGPGLQDRRVEITGPVDRKMVINALNCGSRTFMADFEDANSPTWDNCINGQVNLRDAIHRTISYTNPSTNKAYKLSASPAVLMVRPRGWHLDEAHLLIDGQPCSASLFDFGLYMFHNAITSIQIGHGPYFYLPKLESHLEARLWNDVFNMAQDMLNLPRGTIRATVLIETILAAFEMEEILYELRDHSAGLNCGRWDYIFSLIKKFRLDSRFILPDRSAVTMKVPFMDAYVKLLIQTCHKRGVHAMGGMAAQIPVKNNPERNELAMNQVTMDKEREVLAGHDGTWVAHPALVSVAKNVFDTHMPGPNQLHIQTNVIVSAQDLLNTHIFGGKVSNHGVEENVRVSLMYTEHWLKGVGAVDINGLMEDAATAEIARSQVWQWCKHRVMTQEGRTVDPKWIHQLVQKYVHEHSAYQEAATLLLPLLTGHAWSDFITTVCYNHMTKGCRTISKL